MTAKDRALSESDPLNQQPPQPDSPHPRSPQPDPAALPELYALVDRDEERVLQGVIDLAAELEPDVGRRQWVYEAVRGRIGRRVVLNSLRGLERTLDPPPRETASDGAAPRTGAPGDPSLPGSAAPAGGRP